MLVNVKYKCSQSVSSVSKYVYLDAITDVKIHQHHVSNLLLKQFLSSLHWGGSIIKKVSIT